MRRRARRHAPTIKGAILARLLGDYFADEDAAIGLAAWRYALAARLLPAKDKNDG